MNAIHSKAELSPQVRAGDVGLLIAHYGERMFICLPKQDRERGGVYHKDQFLEQFFTYPIRSMIRGLELDTIKKDDKLWKEVGERVRGIAGASSGKTLVNIHRELVDTALEHAGELTKKAHRKRQDALFNPDSTVVNRHLSLPEVDELRKMLKADMSVLRTPEVMADFLPILDAENDPRAIGLLKYVEDELNYSLQEREQSIGSAALYEVVPESL